MKFLNATAHTLSDEQLRGLDAYEIFSLKEIAPSLHAKLMNCPAELRELQSLARTLGNVCTEYECILFPIGSPAFMWVFTEMWASAIGNKIVFSHSVRSSVEKPDGTKISVFKHVEFIDVRPCNCGSGDPWETCSAESQYCG